MVRPKIHFTYIIKQCFPSFHQTCDEQNQGDKYIGEWIVNHSPYRW